jgi:hypothetical protein
MGFGDFFKSIGDGIVHMPSNLYRGVIAPIGKGIAGGAQTVAKIPEAAWKSVLKPAVITIGKGSEAAGRAVYNEVLKPVSGAGQSAYRDVLVPVAQGTGGALGGLGTALQNMNSTLLLAGGLVVAVVLLR